MDSFIAAANETRKKAPGGLPRGLQITFHPSGWGEIHDAYTVPSPGATIFENLVFA
jgi:hypothetical protein